MNNDIIQRPTRAPQSRAPQPRQPVYPENMQPLVVAKPPEAQTNNTQRPPQQQGQQRIMNDVAPAPNPQLVNQTSQPSPHEQSQGGQAPSSAPTDHQNNESEVTAKKQGSKKRKPIGVIVLALIISISLIALAVYVGMRQSSVQKNTTNVVS